MGGGGSWSIYLFLSPHVSPQISVLLFSLFLLLFSFPMRSVCGTSGKALGSTWNNKFYCLTPPEFVAPLSSSSLWLLSVAHLSWILSTHSCALRLPIYKRIKSISIVLNVSCDNYVTSSCLWNITSTEPYNFPLLIDSTFSIIGFKATSICFL